MTMPHLMNCAHDENGWCLDCVEELWSKTQIPPEMLEAATVRYMLNIGYSEQAVKMHRQDNDAAWQDAQRHTRLILDAAGVPALLAKVADAEQVIANLNALFDSAKAMLAANGIYDASLTDCISVLLEQVRTARQDAAIGWKAAEQYLNDAEKMRERVAELERELAKVREVAHENFDYLEQQLSPEGRE